MRAMLFCIVGERAQHHIVADERHGDFFEDRAHEYHIQCEQKHAHDGDCYAEEQAGRLEEERQQLDENLADIRRQREESVALQRDIELGNATSREDVQRTQAALAGKRAAREAASKQLTEQKVRLMALQKRLSRFRVSAEELAFTPADTAPLSLPSGERVYLEGKIDRVDVLNLHSDLYARVIDYKTGNTALGLDDVYFGLRLQLFLYLDAVLALRGAKPAGVFYQKLSEAPMRLAGGRIDEKLAARTDTASKELRAQVDADIPEYVEKITVHAYVPLEWKTVNLWAWLDPDGTNAFDTWPGKAMTENENGWFTARVPNWVNSIIVSGNEGEVQTEDVAIEPKELWITVYDDLSYELAYEDPETAGVENITVYAQVPADWEGPCLWAWSAPDGTNAFAAWPGEAMTEADGWYALEAPGWINSVIINANEGGVQTTDLSVESGKDVWVVVTDAENASVSYEQPAGDAAGAESPAPEASPAATEAPAEAEGGSSATVWIIVAVVVVAVVVVAVVVSKKKKKD